jgi:hypothetical protein
VRRSIKNLSDCNGEARDAINITISSKGEDKTKTCSSTKGKIKNEIKTLDISNLLLFLFSDKILSCLKPKSISF